MAVANFRTVGWKHVSSDVGLSVNVDIRVDSKLQQDSPGLLSC
jgi:hypothetical protein